MSPFEEGQVLMMRGQVDLAIKKFGEALNGDFHNEDTLFYLASCFKQVGWNGLSAVLSLACINERQAKKLPLGDVLLNLGLAYKAEQQIEAAKAAWETGLGYELEPRNRSLLIANIATLYVNEGCPEKAIPYAEEALRIDPANFHARVAIGLASLELGRWKEG